MWPRSAVKTGFWRRKRRTIASEVSSSGMARAIMGAVMPRMVADFSLERTP